MKVRYMVLGLAAVSLLAAGCNKQAATQNSQPVSNSANEMGSQMSSSTGDDMMNGTSTMGNMMMGTSTDNSMMMSGTSTMMSTSSNDEMMQK